MSAVPTAADLDVPVPESIQKLLRYPNVGLTRYNCPHDHCSEPLAYTGTEYNDIYDDAGYKVGHEERETYECFAGHRVHETGPERNLSE